MAKEEIDRLPFVAISEEQVLKNLQCTVCMEDFKVDEKVRSLECLHCYHNDCIVPWLQMVYPFIHYYLFIAYITKTHINYNSFNLNQISNVLN
jgi:hypothetical protein